MNALKLCMLGILPLLAGCATWDYAYTPDHAAFTQQLIQQDAFDQQRAIERQADYAYQVINQQTAAFPRRSSS